MRCDGYLRRVTTDAAASTAANPTERGAGQQAGTITVRIALATKQQVAEHARDGESVNDTIRRVLGLVPTDTDVDRDRNAVAAYLRTHLVKDFLDNQEADRAPGDALWRELAALQYPGEVDTNKPTAVVLDHTALRHLALGNRELARLLYTKPHQHARHVFAPAEAMMTAQAQHPSASDHVMRIGVVEPVALTGDTAGIIGKRVSPNVNPAVAHIVYTASPSTAWPTGIPIITEVPAMYQGYRLAVRPLPIA